LSPTQAAAAAAAAAAPCEQRERELPLLEIAIQRRHHVAGYSTTRSSTYHGECSTIVSSFAHQQQLLRLIIEQRSQRRTKLSFLVDRQRSFLRALGTVCSLSAARSTRRATAAGKELELMTRRLRCLQFVFRRSLRFFVVCLAWGHSWSFAVMVAVGCFESRFRQTARRERSLGIWSFGSFEKRETEKEAIVSERAGRAPAQHARLLLPPSADANQRVGGQHTAPIHDVDTELERGSSSLGSRQDQ